MTKQQRLDFLICNHRINPNKEKLVMLLILSFIPKAIALFIENQHRCFLSLNFPSKK